MFAAVIKRESSTTNTVELYVVHPVFDLGAVWLPLPFIIMIIIIVIIMIIIVAVV